MSVAQQEAYIKDKCLPLRAVLGHMNMAEFYISICLLDCCRDWPLGNKMPKPVDRGGKVRGGLVTVDEKSLAAKEGSIIGFATRDGDVAKDQSTVMPEHSPFTAALLSNLTRPDLNLSLLVPAITDAVKADTCGMQVPNVRHDLGMKGATTILFPRIIGTGGTSQ